MVSNIWFNSRKCKLHEKSHKITCFCERNKTKVLKRVNDPYSLLASFSYSLFGLFNSVDKESCFNSIVLLNEVCVNYLELFLQIHIIWTSFGHIQAMKWWKPCLQLWRQDQSCENPAFQSCSAWCREDIWPCSLIALNYPLFWVTVLSFLRYILE